MSNYKDSIECINEAIKNAMSPIYESQKTLYDSLALSRTMQNLINEMMRPYQEFSKTITQSFSDSLAEFSRSIAEEMANTIKSSLDLSLINKELAESIRRMYIAPDLINVTKEHTYDFLEDLGGLPVDNDFVTVDEAAVKEYDISDSIAIPIGHNRIKMKTSDFIALVSLISQLIFAIIGLIPSAPTEAEMKQRQAEETQILLLESQNQILRELFHNIDLSSSSQAEFLQSLKESVEAQSTAISDLEESLDSIQQSLDSMSESENTESEN